MAKQLHKYMDVDVLSFLEERMKANTLHYQSDFEIDKKMFRRMAASDRKEDKSLLWMSRPMGTQLVKEHDAFIKDTAAHTTWRFFAEQTKSDPIVAFAVELTGKKDGVIRGNLYELDYAAHAHEVAAKSVDPLDEEKIFQDGFTVRVPLERSSYPFYSNLVDEHGPIVESYAFPRDAEQHSLILSQQKQERTSMLEAVLPKPELFIFDDDICVSDDMTKLDGYVWGTDDLVSRLEAQEPPLSEDQFRENINFYPVYDIENESITLEGHYWLEGPHTASGNAFTLPLSSEEQEQLRQSFEAYCRKQNGVGCLDFLNQVRQEAGLGKIGQKSLDCRIAEAAGKACQGREANIPSKSHTSNMEIGKQVR